jgi:hypothetical protein
MRRKGGPFWTRYYIFPFHKMQKNNDRRQKRIIFWSDWKKVLSEYNQTFFSSYIRTRFVTIPSALLYSFSLNCQPFINYNCQALWNVYGKSWQFSFLSVVSSYNAAIDPFLDVIKRLPILRLQPVDHALDFRESKWFIRRAGTLV